jgi:hypothetical protein
LSVFCPQQGIHKLTYLRSVLLKPRTLEFTNFTSYYKKATRVYFIFCNVKLYHIMLIEYTSPWVGFELTALTITSPTCVVIGTDCIGSCKSNYHTLYDHDHDDPFISWFDTSIHENWTTTNNSEMKLHSYKVMREKKIDRREYNQKGCIYRTLN